MSRQQDFENWMRRQVFTDRDEGPCKKIVLRHFTPGGKLGSEVITILVNKTEDFPVTTCEELMSAASSDADGFGRGTQTYVAQSYFGDEKSASARFALRVRSDSPEDDDDGLLSEPATKHGLIAQLMRHSEASARISSHAMGSTFEALNKTVMRLADQNEILMVDRFKSMELMEDLISQRHVRDVEMLREERRAQMSSDALEKLGPLVPAVINKIAGKKLLPAADPQSLALKAFFSSLEPAQFESLIGLLKPEQAALVLSLAETHIKPDTPKPSS